MIFWILLAVVAVIVIAITVYHSRSRWGFEWDEWLPSVGITLFISGLLGAIVVCVGVSCQQLNSSTLELQQTSGLRALVTKSATEEHAEAVFFLGFGYASSDSVEVSSISYIQVADDGGSTLERADIGQSVIYEGAKQPYVEDWARVAQNDGFWVPWDWTYVSPAVEHRFHIPEGTIIDKYEVQP